MEERNLRAILAQSKSIKERALLLADKAQSLDGDYYAKKQSNQSILAVLGKTN